MLAALAVACCLSAAQPVVTSIQRDYTGVFADVDGGAVDPVFEFNVQCLVTPTESEGMQIDFVVVQEPHLALPWHLRYGRQSYTSSGTTTDPLARIRLEYAGRESLRELSPFLIPVGSLSEGEEWTDGQAVYSVVGSVTVAGRPCWRIEAHNRIGYFRTLQVDRTTGALVALHERVFLGQGDEFSLEYRLVSERELEPETAARTISTVDHIHRLQSIVGSSRLPFPVREEQVDWESELETLRATAEETPLTNLVAVMQREYQQAGRLADGVAQLAGEIVGREVPEFTLELLSGEASRPGDRAGRVVVLHFWNYRHETLEEPYGQVGYLDFLENRLRSERVLILGVATGTDLSDPARRPAALRSIRALRQFMNLGYGIGLDAGELLEIFGDPRSAGAELPLWIVISPQGIVEHYHAGHFEIDPNRGLEELEGIIRSHLPQASE